MRKLADFVAGLVKGIKPSASVSKALPSFHSEEDSIQVHLYREKTGLQGTFGRLVHESGWECVTLELPWRSNVPGVSCIPPGPGVDFVDYDFHRDFSPARGEDVFEAIKVKGRSQIQIHPANLGGDTTYGYASELLGCIALGEKVDVFRAGSIEGQNLDQEGITNSKTTIKEFERIVGAKKFRMRIHGIRA